MTDLTDYIGSLSAEDQRAIQMELNDLFQSLPIRSLRERAGLTQSELANKMGVSQAAISGVENRTDMLLSTFFSYTKAVGATASLRVELNSDEYELRSHFQEEDEYHEESFSFTLEKRRVTETIANVAWTRGKNIKKSSPIFRVMPELCANDDTWSAVSYG